MATAQDQHILALSDVLLRNIAPIFLEILQKMGQSLTLASQSLIQTISVSRWYRPCQHACLSGTEHVSVHVSLVQTMSFWYRPCLSGADHVSQTHHVHCVVFPNMPLRPLVEKPVHLNMMGLLCNHAMFGFHCPLVLRCQREVSWHLPYAKCFFLNHWKSCILTKVLFSHLCLVLNVPGTKTKSEVPIAFSFADEKERKE